MSKSVAGDYHASHRRSKDLQDSQGSHRLLQERTDVTKNVGSGKKTANLPSKKGGKLNAFFESSAEAKSSVDWEDRSRGAYSTVSKMKSARDRLEQRETPRNKILRAKSYQPDLVTRLADSPVRASGLESSKKLDAFFARKRASSNDLRVDRDVQSTMSRTRRSKTGRPRAPTREGKGMDKLDDFLAEKRKLASKQEKVATDERSRGAYSTMSRVRKSTRQPKPSSSFGSTGGKASSKESMSSVQRDLEAFLNRQQPARKHEDIETRSAYTSMEKARKQKKLSSNKEEVIAMLKGRRDGSPAKARSREPETERSSKEKANVLESLTKNQAARSRTASTEQVTKSAPTKSRTTELRREMEKFSRPEVERANSSQSRVQTTGQGNLGGASSGSTKSMLVPVVRKSVRTASSSATSPTSESSSQGSMSPMKSKSGRLIQYSRTLESPRIVARSPVKDIGTPKAHNLSRLQEERMNEADAPKKQSAHRANTSSDSKEVRKASQPLNQRSTRRLQADVVQGKPEGAGADLSTEDPRPRRSVSRSRSSKTSRRKVQDESSDFKERSHNQEDIFTYYSWTLTRQDDTKVEQERKKLRDSLMQGPLSRALKRIDTV